MKDKDRDRKKYPNSKEKETQVESLKVSFLFGSMMKHYWTILTIIKLKDVF